MLSKEENERITRVGAGTPMGEVFRRYWLPAALASQLPEADGAPIRVRLLGEDLVAFRQTDGSIGLVSAFCPHRRAPMFFGRNEENGLRCVYHGWKFDKGGACVDMPSEPPDSLFKSKVTIENYPTWEGGGIVWAYLGPKALQPPYPDYEFIRAPDDRRHVSKVHQACNYLQALEGGLDSAHATIMHNENIGDGSWLQNYERVVPRLDVERTDYGYYYTGIRNLGAEQWVRVYQYVMPAMQMRGQVAGMHNHAGIPPLIDGHIWIPIDDENVAVYNFMYAYDASTPFTHDLAIEEERRFGRGPENVLPDFTLRQNMANDYLIDRERQRTQSFTGIAGINTQDVALQEGMGRICDRTQERLGTTDRAIIVMRQLLLEAARDVEAGIMPKGTDPSAYRLVRPIDNKIGLGLDWKTTIADQAVAKF
jgi:phenylpropionate dioxygenase-like ring-hydroxylating dioxygenase large terminal subunit